MNETPKFLESTELLNKEMLEQSIKNDNVSTDLPDGFEVDYKQLYEQEKQKNKLFEMTKQTVYKPNEYEQSMVDPFASITEVFNQRLTEVMDKINEMNEYYNIQLQSIWNTLNQVTRTDGKSFREQVKELKDELFAVKMSFEKQQISYQTLMNLKQQIEEKITK